MHSCAARVDGTVVCWGSNDGSALGYDGGHSHHPVEVEGVTGAVAVAAGDEHSCALLDDGSVRCWGSTHGGPPNGVVPTHGDVIQLAAGDEHTCALLGTGHVNCWGSNSAVSSATGRPTAEPTSPQSRG